MTPSRATALNTLPLTDAGNAERFIARHSADIRFLHSEGGGQWLLWDGSRWTYDSTLKIEALAKITLRQARAASKQGDEQQWLLKSENQVRLHAMIRSAASEQSLAIRPEDLDRDTNLLGCPNGVIDLTIGLLVPASRDALITKQVAVAFDPIASMAQWEGFVLNFADGDRSLVHYLKVRAGATLLGKPWLDKKMIYLYGANGNEGKTTFLRALSGTLGDYAKPLPPGMLLSSGYRNTGRNDIASMEGARLATFSETDESTTFDEGLVKSLTGGDEQRVRRLYKDFRNTRPTYTIWGASNHLPDFHGSDKAVYGRVDIVPCNHTFNKPQNSPDFDELFKTESQRQAILRWMVEGALEYQHSGVTVPRVVQQATDEWASNGDTFQQFVRDCMTPDPTGKLKGPAILAAYKHWCISNGLEYKRPTQLPTYLKKHGYPQDRTSADRFYRAQLAPGLNGTHFGLGISQHAA